MQVIYSPTLPPGCCFICRGSVRDSYIDTAVSIDYYGAFYVCDQCVKEMATIYAYLSFDEYKDLRAAKEELERINYELLKRVGALEEAVDALGRAGYNVDNGVVQRRGGYAPKDSEKPGEDLPVDALELGEGEGTPTQSSDDEGVAELRPDGTGDFSLEL